MTEGAKKTVSNLMTEKFFSFNVPPDCAMVAYCSLAQKRTNLSSLPETPKSYGVIVSLKLYLYRSGTPIVISITIRLT